MTPHERRIIENTALEAATEAQLATARHGFYRSSHEALGVLLEEVHEFQAEVFKKESTRDKAAMRAELIQVAAVAIKAAAAL